MLRRTARNYLRRLLALDDTPERIALAFALGVFLAFSPLLGLHTILGLTVAFLLGLNRVAVLLGVWVNNPYTLVPIYAAAAYVGGLLAGPSPDHLRPELGWDSLLHAGSLIQVIRLRHLWRPVLLGSTILSFVAAFLSYPVALFIVRRGKAFHFKSHDQHKS